MVSLYVGSTSGYSGKSLVSMGLGQRFRNDGLKVGYFKPVGILPIKVENTLIDKDAWFIYRFLAIKDPISQICPIVLTHDFIMKGYSKGIRGLLGKITKSYQLLSKDKDIMLIGGYGSIYSGSVLGVSGLKVIKRLDAKAIIVVKYEGDYCVDYILEAKENLKDRFIGVVLNKVTHEYKQGIRDYIVPFLERKGVDVLGILPHDSLVASVKVEDLNDMLGGKVLCRHDRLDNLVEQFLIGAMQVDKAIEYFKRTKYNAVIVGGDRADMQLSAIEAGTECLILTGDLYPNNIIIAKAEEKGVPILVVRDDTYSVAKKVEKLSVKLGLRDKAKVERGVSLIIENVDFPLIYKKLGMS